MAVQALKGRIVVGHQIQGDLEVGEGGRVSVHICLWLFCNCKKENVLVNGLFFRANMKPMPLHHLVSRHQYSRPHDPRYDPVSRLPGLSDICYFAWEWVLIWINPYPMWFTLLFFFRVSNLIVTSFSPLPLLKPTPQLIYLLTSL